MITLLMWCTLQGSPCIEYPRRFASSWYCRMHAEGMIDQAQPGTYVKYQCVYEKILKVD